MDQIDIFNKINYINMMLLYTRMEYEQILKKKSLTKTEIFSFQTFPILSNLQQNL